MELNPIRDTRPRKTAADYRRDEAERLKELWLSGALKNPHELKSNDEPTPRGMHSGRVLRLDGIAARQIKLELSGVIDSERLHRRQEWEQSQKEQE